MTLPLSCDIAVVPKTFRIGRGKRKPTYSDATASTEPPDRPSADGGKGGRAEQAARPKRQTVIYKRAPSNKVAPAGKEDHD